MRLIHGVGGWEKLNTRGAMRNKRQDKMQCDVMCQVRSAKCEMQKNAKCDASLCPSPTILLSFLPLSIRRLGSPPFHPVSVSARHSYFSASSMLSLSARHLLQLRLITIHSRVKGGGTLLLVMVLVLLLVQNIK